MTDRSAPRRIAAGAFAVMAGGLVMLGATGTASASPVPGVPYTTADLCTKGGGTVTTVAPGVQRCHGGGDTGDVVVSAQQAEFLAHALPKPPVKSPSLPG